MKFNLVKCPFCDEQRKSTGLHKHIKTHGPQQWEAYLRTKPAPKTRINNGLFECSECTYSNASRQSVTSHWWRNHTAKGKTHIKGKGNGYRYKDSRVAWNKGLTKETDTRIKEMGEKISVIQQQQIKDGTYIPRHMGLTALQELSERMSLNNPGGRCKWYVVDGVKVQGTYEKAFAEQLVKQKVKWEKIKTNNHIFKYTINGKIKSYAPDFYLPDLDMYIELKGVWWGEAENKMKVVREQHRDKKVVILYGKKKIDYICESIIERLPLEPVWSW